MMHTLCAKSMWRKEEAKVKRLYLILSLLFVISKASAHFFKNRVYKQMSSLIVMVLDSCFSLSYFLFYSEIFFLYFHPMLPSNFPYHLYSANRSPQCPPAFFLLYVLEYSCNVGVLKKESAEWRALKRWIFECKSQTLQTLSWHQAGIKLSDVTQAENTPLLC